MHAKRMARKSKKEKQEDQILSRRLRRWRDVRELENAAAAEILGIPVSTYEDALYAMHWPRGAGKALLSRLLDAEERKLKLEPIK